MIKFGREVCGNLEAATGREWLETNGLGGYTSATVCNLNMRRYHGLLVAALNPPNARFVLLSKLEETLVVKGRRIDLSSNRYGDIVQRRASSATARWRRELIAASTMNSGMNLPDVFSA